MAEENRIDLSIVAPVYNEEENLPILVSQLVGVLGPLRKAYEMIFVDDGSKDRSRQVLKEMASKHPQLRILGFKYNCGESAALYAGLREARGEIVITLDADLQKVAAELSGPDRATTRSRLPHPIKPTSGRT